MLETYHIKITNRIYKMSIRITLQEKSSCVSSFISWDRLAKQLKACGELAKDESVTDFVVSESGIEYFVVNEVE